MVGDKLPTCPIDMEKEPIQIMVEGDYITADGTTLGGDDGIAVAYGLALLDSKDIPHPRLEVVLTVSEETGLEGAHAVNLDSCKAKRLLNIDSEEEGVFTVGCAGGMRVNCSIPVETTEDKGIYCEVKTSGLLGGHSGIEIHKGRINGNVILGRFFLFLKGKVEFEIVEMSGGVKDNVIPKNAVASFLVKDVDALKAALEVFNGQLNAEYGTADPDAKLVLSVGEERECAVLTACSKEKVLTALNGVPNGVQAMSQDLPGLVETSLNMGVMKLDGTELMMSFSLRSSVVTAKEYLASKLTQLTEMLGGTTKYRGDYPAWPYARESKLRDLCLEIYKDQYGKDAKVEIIHAGLECGILSGKIEGLDCISIGPNMFDVHTPDEKISISSITRVWEFIKAVLAYK